jgi:monoamine oxidase
MNFRKTPILIIGAGVAGLTIASKLRKEDYIILEARDRIGGRVFTHENNIDCGAAWVHGLNENPLTNLLSSDNLIPVAECNPWMHSENANIQYLMKDSNFTEEKRQQLAAKWKAQLTDGISNNDPEIQSFLYMIEVWCGASIRNLPASFFQEGEELFGDYGGPHCLFKKGAKTLIDALCNNVCKDNIICNQIVTNVVHTDDDFVKVYTRDGSIYTCKKLCVTVPPGPLRDIVFDPPLSQSKIDALSRVKMGSYKKVQLEFDEVFWNRDKPMILTQGEDDQFVLWNNYMSSKKLPILEAICPADIGWSMVGKGDDEIIGSVMDHLKKYFRNVPFPKS